MLGISKVEDLAGFFAQHDVVLVVDAGQGTYNVSGFSLYGTESAGPNTWYGRGHGVVAYVCDMLVPLVASVTIKHMCVWLRLQQRSGGAALTVGVQYMNPSLLSTARNSMFDEFQQDWCAARQVGRVFVLGDCSAR